LFFCATDSFQRLRLSKQSSLIMMFVLPVLEQN
jgi:hypothetical protein